MGVMRGVVFWPETGGHLVSDGREDDNKFSFRSFFEVPDP